MKTLFIVTMVVIWAVFIAACIRYWRTPKYSPKDAEAQMRQYYSEGIDKALEKTK